MDKNNVTECLLNVINRHHFLTVDGVGIHEHYQRSITLTPNELAIIHHHKRAALLSPENIASFEVSCDYLRTVEITKRISSKVRAYSYQQKHRVEEWGSRNGKLVYVPEGTFIAAALAMENETGIITRFTKGYSDAEFNIKIKNNTTRC